MALRYSRQATDLRAATVEDARAFFERFYHPQNASLAIGGDIETSDALALAEDLFAAIPAGPPVTRMTMPIPAPRPVTRTRPHGI